MENRDPELEKNFILFTILAMAVIFGWMYFFAKPQPRKLPEKPGTRQPQPGKTDEPTLQGGTAQAITPQTPPEMKTAKAAEPVTAAAAAFPLKTVSVQSPLYDIEFSSRAAAPTSWKLKKYKDRVYFPYEISLKWPPLEKINRFQPVEVDLISPSLGKGIQLGTGIVINNIPIPADAAWEVATDKLDVSQGPAELVFTLPLPENGVTLKKIYTFYPDKYSADLKIMCEGQAIDPAASRVDFGLSYVFEPLNRLASINFHGPLFYSNQAKIQRIKLGAMNKAAEQKLNNPGLVQPINGGTAEYAGFTDSYFLTALLAPAGDPFIVQSFYSGDTISLGNKKANKEYSMDVTVKPTAKAAAARILADVGLYFGPKEKDILQSVRPTLGLTIDYGFFAVIAIPMMYALKYTNMVVKNYGWSIVILTIVLRMAMFPLTRKSQKSMKEMQKLQPEIQKIKEKYPNDRMKQQEETYALQRKYKINPLGGCLPMVIQIPIFFAFYKVLMVSIELRHASWLSFWIPDLSSRDPLLILPLLMGVSQFFMGRLTPTATTDPTQAKMMQLMPLFMTVILIYFPSGLLLYWTVSNIIGIGQQVYVNQLPE